MTRKVQAKLRGQEDTLEKGMAIHSSIFAWRIPWTEEPGRLQSMGLKDWVTNTFTFTARDHIHIAFFFFIVYCYNCSILLLASVFNLLLYLICTLNFIIGMYVWEKSLIHAGLDTVCGFRPLLGSYPLRIRGCCCINNNLRIWNLINKSLGKKGELADVFEGETNRILGLIGCSGWRTGTSSTNHCFEGYEIYIFFYS